MSLPAIGTEPDIEPGPGESTDDVVAISRAELDELRRRASSSGVVPSPLSVIANLDREIEARDRKVADLEAAYRRAVRDRELATSLAGRPLVSGAANQLIKLWRDDFDVYEESGEYRVTARDGRPLDQWVADRLGGPDYAHFRLPNSRGGVGSRGLSQATATDDASKGARTLGEAVITHWRETAANRPSPPQGGSGWGRVR